MTAEVQSLYDSLGLKIVEQVSTLQFKLLNGDNVCGVSEKINIMSLVRDSLVDKDILFLRDQSLYLENIKHLINS